MKDLRVNLQFSHKEVVSEHRYGEGDTQSHLAGLNLRSPRAPPGAPALPDPSPRGAIWMKKLRKVQQRFADLFETVSGATYLAGGGDVLVPQRRVAIRVQRRMYAFECGNRLDSTPGMRGRYLAKNLEKSPRRSNHRLPFACDVIPASITARETVKSAKSGIRVLLSLRPGTPAFDA